MNRIGLLVIGYLLFVVGYLLLVICCWLLVIGYWLLVSMIGWTRQYCFSTLINCRETALPCPDFIVISF